MDSCTNYFPTKKLFEIQGFYNKNYTEYCEGITPNIRLLFELLTGTSYEAASQINTVDNNTIEFTNSAYCLIKLYDRIMNCPDLKVECSMNREDLVPNFITHPMDRFIREKGTCIVKDVSSYTIRFKRVE